MGCGASKAKMGEILDGLPLRNEPSSLPKIVEILDDDATTIQDAELTSTSHNNCSTNEYLCGTDITLQWLHKKLMEALNADEPIPNWIAECIDTLPYASNKFQRSKIIKVTLGWENAQMPSSVILKVPTRIQDEETGALDEERNRRINSMFKRECTVYEWFAKQKKIAVPHTLHIKKHSTESSCGVIVMEDLGDNGQRGNMKDGLTVDGAKDLLRNLAIIHAKSLLSGEWSTMVPDISPLHYHELAEKRHEASNIFFKSFTRKEAEILNGYLSADYMANVVTEGNMVEKYGLDRVLVHGQPMALNVFIQPKDKVIAILDWTQAHPGCFGEDIATAICWNMDTNERHQNQQRLLECYHYNLIKHSAGRCQATMEQVKQAYAHFMPLAMSVLLLHCANIEMGNEANEVVLERIQGIARDILREDHQQSSY